MDENRIVQANYRNFALPLYLLSAAFFGIDILIILGLLELALSIMLPVLAWLLFLVFMLATCLLIVSPFIGSIQFLRELKAQSLSWKAVIPLCVLSGTMLISTACYYSLPLFFPITDASLQFYCGELFLCTFMSLPAGFAYALRDLRGTRFDTIRSSASLTGAIGLITAVFFPISLWMASGKNNNLGILLIAFPLCCIQIAFLMPLLGLKIFNLARTFSSILPPVEAAGKTGEPLSRKKISDMIRDIPKSVSPGVKWTIVIVIALILIIAGWYFYSDITDTTPGRRWNQATPEAPFGDKESFASIEYKGKLWLIGGTGHEGSDGEAWYTSDGISWTRETSPDMVPSHVGATAAGFRDAVWIIGGADERTHMHGNDIWYSGNGIAWSEMQPKSVFPPRAWHSTVVFRDRIWVIGGRDSTGYRNDVWSSDDGISWVQATPAAGFTPRSDQASFVYQDKIWMIGGRDRTGDLTEVWNSDDGSNWTQVAVPAEFESGNPVSAVTFDGRIWVIQIPHTWGIVSPWPADRPSGIWYSYDGIVWTRVNTSPEFFNDKCSGGEPYPVVFRNRLYVMQRCGTDTGIWYTMPSP